MTTFYFDGPDALTFGTNSEKSNANLDAIRLMLQLRKEDRQATPDEQVVLSMYTGWGDSGVKNCAKDILEDLLTGAEMRSLGVSMLNAHYTALPIIKAVWAGLLHLGIGALSHINVLDPSAGIGHFRSMMPEELREKANWIEIELDLVTAELLKHMHGDKGIINAPFEKTTFAPGLFDLVISNFPFGNYAVVDKSIEPGLRTCIHDFFFVKSMLMLKPGGILAAITSRYTMDKKDFTVRKWLAQHAELLGIVRLPKTTFEDNAGTEVVTDVIFFRKSEQVNEDTEPDWLGIYNHPRGRRYFRGSSRETFWTYNRLFEQHPEWLIGEATGNGTMYNEDEYTVEYPGGAEDIAPLLEQRLMSILPKDLLAASPVVLDVQRVTVEDQPADEPIIAPIFKLHPIHIPEGLATGQRFRLEALRDMYDTAKSLLAAETDGQKPAEEEELRSRLNDIYDRFLMGFGHINSKTNDALMKDSTAWPFLRALEIVEAGKVRKSDIFTRPTVRARWAQRKVVSVSDALHVCLDVMGRIDLDYVAALCEIQKEEAIYELNGMIYQLPETGEWVLADIYLSGNIRQKLDAAEAAAALNPAYERNVVALQNALPTPLLPKQIRARLGAGWIPADVVRDFILMLIPGSNPKLNYVASLGAWSADFDRYGLPVYEMRTKWGTERRSALDLVEDALNTRTPVIYDETEDSKVINKAATLAAQAKLEEIKAKFDAWVWEDPERAARLALIYNRKYNVFRTPKFDGAHLSLPGLSRAFEPHAYQKDAVVRALTSPAALFAHNVGLGKTLAAIISGMEMMRLGIAHKALVAVPNHLTGQWRDAILKAYPDASVLCAGKDDLSKSNRGVFLSRIATGGWNFVVIPMSSNKLLPVGPEVEEGFVNEQVEELRSALEELRRDEDRRHCRNSQKDIEKALKRFEARLEVLAAMKKDSTNTITWEQLGIDLLIVDEFHLYKNLYFHTKMTRVAGLPNSKSERAFDLFMKIRITLKNGGRLIGLTATPVSNTLAEAFTMQRYFQYDALAEMGLSHFDAWAQMFADTVMLSEMTPDGSGFRINTRLAKFTNIPELAAMLAQFSEIKTWDDVGAISVVSRPHLHGGKPSVVKLPANALLKSFTKELAERAEKVKGGTVDKHADNMLKICGDGRKAALDMRLVVSVGNDERPTSKVDVASGVIAQIYHETMAYKSTQLVFCDLGTPAMTAAVTSDPDGNNDGEPEVIREGEKEEEESFENIYASLKEQLVGRGVRSEDVAFIHDAKTPEKRSALFSAVNDGKVRILIGSTEKMGTGMNVQERVIALHHLDAPWRPADIEQRLGRMLRQGNRYSEVFAFVYITESSFDAYLWQILETKARFIEQFMTGQVTGREMDDVSQTVLSMGEIKALASGNPKIITRVTLQSEMAKLESLHSSWMGNRHEMSMRIRSFENDAQEAERRAGRYARAIQLRDAGGEGFKMTIRDQVCYERKVAGDLINTLMSELMKRAIPGAQSQYATIGEFRGFTLKLRYYLPLINATVDGTDASVQEVLLEFGEDLRLVANIGNTGMSTIQSIESILRLLEGHHEKEVRRHAYTVEQIIALTNGLKENWEHEERFIRVKQELAEVEKELVGQGVLSNSGEVVDAPVGENGEHIEEVVATPVAAPEAAEKIDENFDLNAILARIREIHVGLPVEIGNDLVVDAEPVLVPAMVVTSTSVDPGLTWDEWLAQQGVPLKPLRSSRKAAIKVQEGQMALF